MTTKEIIPGFSIEVPAPVYFMPLNDKEPSSVVADKTRKLLEAAGLAPIIQSEKLVAVKQHFGEEGNHNYIKPPVTAGVVAWIREQGGLPLLVETNTLYKGERSDSYHHLMLAHRHGFTMEAVGAPIHILDGVHGQNQHPVAIPGHHFDKVHMVPDLPFFDSMVIMSHAKGHMLAGMGGALKNLAMGFSSRAGKCSQHDDFKPQINEMVCTRCGLCTTYCPENALTLVGDSVQLDPDKCIGCGECYTACQFDAIKFNWSVSDATFHEKMAEHALGAVIRHNKKVIYINYLNNISKECDCWGEDNPVLYPDIGILVSTDPVAIDMASYMLPQEKLGKNVFKELWPDFDSTIQMKHAEKIGLGSCEYELIEVKS